MTSVVNATETVAASATTTSVPVNGTIFGPLPFCPPDFTFLDPPVRRVFDDYFHAGESSKYWAYGWLLCGSLIILSIVLNTALRSKFNFRHILTTVPPLLVFIAAPFLVACGGLLLNMIKKLPETPVDDGILKTQSWFVSIGWFVLELAFSLLLNVLSKVGLHSMLFSFKFQLLWVVVHSFVIAGALGANIAYMKNRDLDQYMLWTGPPLLLSEVTNWCVMVFLIIKFKQFGKQLGVIGVKLAAFLVPYTFVTINSLIGVIALGVEIQYLSSRFNNYMAWYLNAGVPLAHLAAVLTYITLIHPVSLYGDDSSKLRSYAGSTRATAGNSTTSSL